LISWLYQNYQATESFMGMAHLRVFYAVARCVEYFGQAAGFAERHPIWWGHFDLEARRETSEEPINASTFVSFLRQQIWVSAGVFVRWLIGL
jgi:hypothetical protein